jgi:hypothetical protein
LSIDAEQTPRCDASLLTQTACSPRGDRRRKDRAAGALRGASAALTPWTRITNAQQFGKQDKAILIGRSFLPCCELKTVSRTVLTNRIFKNACAWFRNDEANMMHQIRAPLCRPQGRRGRRAARKCLGAAQRRLMKLLFFGHRAAVAVGCMKTLGGAIAMRQESARHHPLRTIAVQLAALSITSVFQNQSVVKDRFAGAISHGGMHATRGDTAQ